MIFCCKSIATIDKALMHPLSHAISGVPRNCFPHLSTLLSLSLLECHRFMSYGSSSEGQELGEQRKKSEIDLVIHKIRAANNEGEVFQSLVQDPACGTIQVTHSFVNKLLNRFKDDWKSALGVFRWVESNPSYRPLPEFYDKLVDILGKMKQMEKMNALVEEMRESQMVSLNTIAKVMRRFAGAGEWDHAVRVFDELENFGLEKNTESMNLLLDTLCKENKVQQARSIFLELKPYIQPNANTFNILIHGWCKINRVEEAYWTIQEMKGYGCQPCVISYSTIIQSYSFQQNFHMVYELLDEMNAKGSPPNVVTFTTVMCHLTKAGELEEALQIAEKMKSVGCSPDTLFYNAMIHTLGRASRVQDAIRVFEEEMPKYNAIPNTSTYNSMIAMFCHHKQEQKALKFLRKMENLIYCKPDVQSFYPLLKLSLKAGKEELLTNLLDDMVNKHLLSLDLSTYTLLIHQLCRTNRCEWAFQLFKEMIGQGITPRYLTCRVLLNEIKQNNMYDAAEVIEDFMKRMKS